MRFLVIGASGFIGSQVLAIARSQGCEALGTQSQPRNPALVTFNALRDRLQSRLPPSFLKSEENIYGVFCVKFGPMDNYAAKRELTHELEVEKAMVLIQEMLTLGIKPIYLSSAAVFDGRTGYYSETHPYNPISVYGEQKVEIEMFLERMAQGTLTLRLDKNVGDDPYASHLLASWYRSIEENNPVVCIKGQLFSPTFVGDVARAIFVSAQNGLSGRYNVANTEFFSCVELAMQFTIALGRHVPIVSKTETELGFLQRRPLKSYLDSTKFVEATGMRFTSMRRVFRSFQEKLKRELTVTENGLRPVH